MRRTLDAGIVVLAAAILLIIGLGGIDYDWWGFHVRLHAISRPVILLAAALAARTWLGGIDLSYIGVRGLLALVLAAAATYATYHVRVCGGLDSYGYVSTASLIAAGHLSEPQPLVPLLPFAEASSAAAPLGYIAGPGGDTQVPRFPLGLPLVMAAFRWFGPLGPFFVPLVMAYATFGLAFALARQQDDSSRAGAATGLLAAVLVAVSPLMVDYGIQPMSDVPATCWLLAALWLRLRGGRAQAGLAGISAGMAFLTRPALLPAALTIGLVFLDRPMKETVRYAVVVLMFAIAQAVLNMLLYGSAGTSGYGPSSYMFEISAARLAANASNFAKWLTYSHTSMVWFLWPFALVVLRHSKAAWQISAIAAAAAVPYLFYLVFDDWESVRFVLPTLVLVLILAATAFGVLVEGARREPVRKAGAVVLFAVALACAAASNRFLANQGVYRFRDLEAKYALAGEWIEAHTPARAVVLAALHSGSIRFYGHRATIRWDQIPPDKLGATLQNLEAAGYIPYLALDTASEPPVFDARFGEPGSIRFEPIGRVRVVNVYRFVSAH